MRVPRHDGILCEQLEPRVILSVDGVGIGFNSNDSDDLVIVTEFSLDDELNYTSASRETAGLGGAQSLGGADPTLFELFNNGRLGVGYEGSPLPNQSGPTGPIAGISTSQFFAEQGYSVGFLGGAPEDQSAVSALFQIERHADASLADLAGNWRFHMLRFVGDAEPVALTGNASMGGAFMLLGPLTGDPGTGVVAETIEFAADDDRGRFDGSGGVRVYLNHDASVFLAVDLDTTDGDAYIAIGTRPDVNAETTPEDIAGRYRVQTFAASTSGADLLGERLTSPWLDIQADGTYTQRDLLLDDRASGDIVASGTWSVTGSTIELTDADSGVVIRYTVSDDGNTLLPIQVQGDAGPATLHGVAQRVSDALIGPPPVDPTPPAGPLTLAQGRVSDIGRPEIFELDETGLWRTVDLITRATGDNVQTETAQDIVVWTDPVDDLTYAAVSTATELFLYNRDADGVWTVRNLTADVPGAEAITSNLVQYIGRDLVVTIAGLNSSGAVVTFNAVPDRIIADGPQFTFRNISVLDLPLTGSTTPEFVGDLTSFVTAWDAQNIVGLDAEGDVWAVWRSPASGGWRTVNLSDQTGADPLQGSLTVFLTSWGGINIAGVIDTGQVLATWWVPGQTWRQANLSNSAGAPPLQVQSVTSWVTPWGALNVGGLDENNDVIALFWLPGFDSWRVANLTSSLDPGDPRPQGALEASVLDSGVMNVFGTQGDDDHVRVYWTPDQPGWRIENLSMISVVG